MEDSRIPKGLRGVKDVMTKISLLEREFRAANDFLHNTGAGIEDETGLKAVVEKKVSFYHGLAPVMSNRASTWPLYLNEFVSTEQAEKIDEHNDLMQSNNIDAAGDFFR